MKKISKIAIITLFCAALCACSSKAALSKDAIAREYAELSSLTLRADVTADCGDRVFEYGMKYEGSPEGGTITVVSPDSIAGLRVNTDFSSGEAALLYDGAELMAGELDSDGLTAVSAIPAMLDRWKNGYVTEASGELLGGSKYTALTYPISGETTLKTWFDPDTLLPYRAEIAVSGKTVIFCEFQDVTIN
ncbi:MAG: hypothetical protein IKI49_05590 [Oscillospiraceae bacterium]|nr:hypothetical protein [Oscillospiraceae bacterium]